MKCGGEGGGGAFGIRQGLKVYVAALVHSRLRKHMCLWLRLSDHCNRSTAAFGDCTMYDVSILSSLMAT